MIWREVRDGLRLHWKSTSARTELTCVPMVRFGFGLRFERLRTLAQLCIGITREVGRLLRFFEAGSPFVSGPFNEIRSR